MILHATHTPHSRSFMVRAAPLWFYRHEPELRAKEVMA
jgi:hypothetical protein